MLLKKKIQCVVNMGCGLGSSVASIVICVFLTIGYVASDNTSTESHVTDTSVIYKDDREYLLTCSNNNTDYTNLQPFNSSVTFKNVKLTNCFYPSSMLWTVLDYMKISTAHLVLDKWTMDHSLNFINMTHLEILEIREAKLYSTEISLRSLSDLTELHFVSSGLSTQHIELPNKLKIINLSINNLETLKEDFLHNLTQLQTFIVSNNKIKQLPRYVFAQNPLRILDLSKNQISELPVEIFSNLTDLRELYLQENKIEVLSPTLVNLINLRILNLRYNEIQTFPRDVHYISSLLKLYLGHNKLSKLDTNVLPIYLTTLDLSNNNLSDNICHTDISKLFDLEHLELQHNKIKQVCVSWPFLVSLRMLNMSHNSFTYLNYDNFKFPNSNITVDYSYNQINSIDFLEENPMISRGKTYYLEGNPITCDGYIFWFVKMAQDNNMFGTTIQDADCQHPEHLKGKRLSSLDLDKLPADVECGSVGEDLKRCAACTYQNDKKEFRINCSSVDSSKLWTFDTRPEMYSVVVVVENGNLTAIPAALPANVTAIYAAHNYIREVPAFSNKLEYIDLSDNRISYVPPEAVDRLISDETRLKLSDNSLMCDCENSHLINKMYVYHYNVEDYDMILCANGTSLSSLQLPLVCGDAAAVWILVVIGLAVVVAVCVMIFGACYKYRYVIKSILYSRGWLLSLVLQEELDKTKQYDAFVSYAHGDEDFITDELLPMLEGEPHKFSLCVHHRDWLPGADIPSQIVKSVEDSRRTIVVLSQNFVKSVWGRAEFRAATAETVRTGLPRVLVVMLHDIETLNDVDPELKAYLATNMYFERGDPLFWEKLSYALPHRRHGKRSQFLEPMSAEEQRLRRKQLNRIVDYVEKEFAKQREMGIDNVAQSDDIKNSVLKLNGIHTRSEVSNCGIELQQCVANGRLTGSG